MCIAAAKAFDPDDSLFTTAAMQNRLGMAYDRDVTSSEVAQLLTGLPVVQRHGAAHWRLLIKTIRPKLGSRWIGMHSGATVVKVVSTEVVLLFDDDQEKVPVSLDLFWQVFDPLAPSVWQRLGTL